MVSNDVVSVTVQLTRKAPLAAIHAYLPGTDEEPWEEW